jgi:hypothetical protein
MRCLDTSVAATLTAEQSRAVQCNSPDREEELLVNKYPSEVDMPLRELRDEPDDPHPTRSEGGSIKESPGKKWHL